MQYRIEVAAVDSLLITFDIEIEAQPIIQLASIAQRLKQTLAAEIVDVVPAYNTLLVIYDCVNTTYRSMAASIGVVIDESLALGQKASQPNLIEIPVCYDAEYSPDMQALSERLSLSPEAIVSLHSEQLYTVLAVGFSPGFGYLGKLNEQLKVPRLASPRTKVPQGSVAIAELNTAVYPQETPGGWWLIGRSPLPMFDKTRSQPCLYQVGDQVRFVPISVAEYLEREQAL